MVGDPSTASFTYTPLFCTAQAHTTSASEHEVWCSDLSHLHRAVSCARRKGNTVDVAPPLPPFEHVSGKLNALFSPLGVLLDFFALLLGRSSRRISARPPYGCFSTPRVASIRWPPSHHRRKTNARRGEKKNWMPVMTGVRHLKMSACYLQRGPSEARRSVELSGSFWHLRGCSFSLFFACVSH